MTAMNEIQRCVELLRDGWNERIEYRVRIHGHLEMRANNVRMAGLLAQLYAYAHDGDPGPDAGAQRRSPNEGGSRPPGRVGGLMLLDEITAEIRHWLTELGYTGRATNAHAMLGALQTEAENSHDPHCIVPHIAERARDWVRQARKILAHDDGQVMFTDTVCGECGGALAVGRDAARATAVRCVGTPAAQSCGRRYGRDEWLALANGMAGQPVDTAAAVLLLAPNGATKAEQTAARRMIYNRAREGALTRYGGPGHSQARWDPAEVARLRGGDGGR